MLTVCAAMAFDGMRESCVASRVKLKVPLMENDLTSGDGQSCDTKRLETLPLVSLILGCRHAVGVVVGQGVGCTVGERVVGVTVG
jgi:hypothetical protein